MFVSHTNADAELAHRIANDLAKEGAGVWIAPESIRPGEGWVDAINRGLEVSTDVVVLLTPPAVASQWVRQEMSAAIALERQGRLRVIPLDVEPCDVPPLWEAYQKISLAPDYGVGARQLIDTLVPRRGRSGSRAFAHPAASRRSIRATGGETVLDDLDSYARLYDSLYPRLSGEVRNFILNAVFVDQLFRVGHLRKFTGATLTRLFAKGKDGDRMIALLLLQTAPTMQCLQIAIDAIENPRSPFEQFQGLRSVGLMTHLMGEAQRQKLTSVLEVARRRYLIPANASRWEMYRQISADLATRARGRRPARAQ